MNDYVREFDLSNPHLPPAGARITLPAYNLLKGAAFMVPDEPDPRVWVVQKVVRDCDFERVNLWCRTANFEPEFTNESAFNLDYQSPVILIGLVVNEYDRDDNDWGNSLS